ncbi:MAG: ribonuclease H family protein [Pirellulaceae bacterium]
MGKKKKPKFYVVWEGKAPGVYTTWSECEAATRGFAGARFKSFSTLAGAEQAYSDGPSAHWGKKEPRRTFTQEELAEIGIPIEESLCVDAAWNAQTKVLEYRGVWYRDRSVLFEAGPYPNGTNNIGEFLAIVHGLALMAKEGNQAPVYTDSLTAISWVTKIAVRSKSMDKGETSAGLNRYVKRALSWLRENPYPNQILKWRTDVWGEIPADYGRK